MFKNINGVLIRFALSVLKRLVLDKIQYEPVQKITQSFYTRLEAVAGIVTDNDPDNRAQLEAYWKANQRGVALEAVTTAQAIVLAEVDNEVVRDLLSDLLRQVAEELGG